MNGIVVFRVGGYVELEAAFRHTCRLERSPKDTFSLSRAQRTDGEETMPK